MHSDDLPQPHEEHTTPIGGADLASERFGNFTEWPVVGWEKQRWIPSPGTASRRELREQTGTYQSAVVPAIADRQVWLPPDLVYASEEAANEISRFDAEMGSEIAPFAAVLLRSEAAASSRIENLTASSRSIALAEIGDTSKKNASMIVANTRAMQAAVRLSDDMDEVAIIEMHRALLESSDPTITGQWRDSAVWIGKSDVGPVGAEFVAPHHSRIPDSMSDLVTFMRREDIPIIAHAAISHSQFETIHPFPDGNGRTGRALIHSLNRYRGLTRNITVPISAGLLRNIDQYFAALTSYRDGDLRPIIEMTAAASFAAIANGREMITNIRAVRESWNDRIKSRKDSAVWKVADLLLRQPVVDSRTVQRELKMGHNNVPRYVDVLVDSGILKEFSGFKRNRCWRADEILVELDNFATRSGRRAYPGKSTD